MTLFSVLVFLPRHGSEQKAFLTHSAQTQSVPNTDTTPLSFHAQWPFALVHLEAGTASPVNDLCPPAGEKRFFHEVSILGAAVGPVHLALACLLDQPDDPWFVASDEPTDVKTLDEYRSGSRPSSETSLRGYPLGSRSELFENRVAMATAAGSTRLASLGAFLA
jgi:hypothetical protein